MRRRKFVALLGSVMVTWPFAAHAQQKPMPVIGVLSTGSPSASSGPLDAFRHGLSESRDPKGHYAKARAGTLKAFTGIGNDYQPPSRCELTIDTSARSVADATDEIERMLAESGILFSELVDLAANI